MPTNNSLILPLVLWDNIAPTCNISSLIINESETNLITGTTSGHIIIWDFNLDDITPVCVLMGHTSSVNCLARAGLTKTEEYFVSSSENGEMKLWELTEKICLENIKMSNNIHKNIYSTRVHGKYTRLFCIGNYTDVLIIDPMTLDIIYTLVSREQHQWINALCINTLPNKNDEVIVGMSVSGIIKLWTLGFNEPKGAEIIEHEFKYCDCENARTLVSCPGKHRIFLIVCAKFFQIFDAFDFTVLCYMNSKSDETFNSGYFIDIDKIMLCTNDGISYIYLLPENHLTRSIANRKKKLKSTVKHVDSRANPQAHDFRHRVGRANVETIQPKLISILQKTSPLDNHAHKFYSPPMFYFYEKKTENQLKSNYYLLRGDCYGHLAMWDLNVNFAEKTEACYEQSLHKFWHQNVKKDDEDIGHVSTFLFLPNLDKLIYGTTDGAIVILSALDYLISRLFEIDKSFHLTKPIKLKKHTSKVTALLYPNGENSRYDSSLFLSGGVDFSVILWNINTGNMIHKFVVQAGEILQLSVPPNNVNPRISQCICSIASDNSVALLSLKECKPVMVASRHLFPILFVKWRPLDDYLIVKCTDGGVYVWQMETGNLDRVAHGLIAEDIIAAADELTYDNLNNTQSNTGAQTSMSSTQQNLLNLSNQYLNTNSSSNKLQTLYVSGNTIANQTLAISNTLQKRNFANSIKLITLKAFNREEEHKKGIVGSDVGTLNFPLVMHTFHFNTHDPVNNLLLFDVDSLLVNLILEEQSIESLLQFLRTNFFNEIHNIQTPPSQLTPLFRTTPDLSGSTLRRIVSAKSWDPTDLKLMNSLKVKVSYAHSVIKITRILLSCLHAWYLDANLDTLFETKLGLLKPKVPFAFGHISRHYHLSVMFPKKISNSFTNHISNALVEFTTREHWSISKCLTTEHLLSILSIANSFMNLQNFIDLQFKSDCDALDFILGDNSAHLVAEGQIQGEGQAILKQSYSRLSTMYCMLADYFKDTSFKTLNLEILAQKWMDPSYEVREAAQSLLKNELKRIGTNGRSALIKLWEPHLSSLLKECEDFSNTSHVSLNLPANVSSPQPQLPNMPSLSSQLNLSQNVSSFSPLSNNYSNMDNNNVQISQSQDISTTSSATDELLPPHHESSSRLKRKQYIAIIILGVMGAEFGQDVTSKTSKAIPQGFSIEDHTILKRISIALAKLLTNKSLQNEVNRRAAIDLMGRGFTVWEPFIQPTYVLLSLLELCADAELYIPRSTLNLPLTPIADACRTARYSLNLIANTKPKTFILTIAKEVKRINSPSGQTAQNLQTNFNVALTRGKNEILQIIEKLIDNQAQDVYELLSDVIEIILYCLDTNQIRTSGLEEAFPAIFKFPMVRYCKETRRIIVGCYNGRLIMYEYRTSKWHFQNFPAHNGQPIVAVGISPDSKYVASYSAHDNSLYIWQTTSGNIFNIGSSSLKQHKVCTVAPIDLNAPITKLASIVWQARTLNLIYYDSRKYVYQV